MTRNTTSAAATRTGVRTAAAPSGSAGRRPPLHRAANTAPIVDETLAESFPASDPPSWTAGVATLAPEAEPQDE